MDKNLVKLMNKVDSMSIMQQKDKSILIKKLDDLWFILVVYQNEYLSFYLCKPSEQLQEPILTNELYYCDIDTNKYNKINIDMIQGLTDIMFDLYKVDSRKIIITELINLITKR